eukprot:scaffold250367_cov31-Tisochrysis_lutea.AAC.1
MLCSYRTCARFVLRCSSGECAFVGTRFLSSLPGNPYSFNYSISVLSADKLTANNNAYSSHNNNNERCALVSRYCH